MACFCLTESIHDLRDRLGRIIVAYTRDKKPVTAADLKANGAMTVLLKDALKPNLVQTLENNPAFIHGGPFANIAHGCNSIIATKMAMRLSEYTVTEAGFGADLGAEKFMNIKCRKGGIKPNAVVIVATVKALKHHGGVPLNELHKPNVEALEKGVENLKKHIENIHRFGLPVVVAINHFSFDTEEEIQFIKDKCAYLTVKIITADHWARGGAGAEELARAVVDVVENTKTDFSLLYPDTCTLWQKVGIICREMYGATDVLADKKLRDKFHALQEAGYGHLPVCMAKTQYSLSTDPLLVGRPKNFDVPLRDVTVAAGAGFVVVLTGEIMTMPGLPKIPAAESIDIDEKGETVGLF
jgi:formate--tetrahydrofolate ligase